MADANAHTDVVAAASYDRDVVLQDNIDQEVLDREALIRGDGAGQINIGDSNTNLDVQGASHMGGTVTVSPNQDQFEEVITPGGGATLPDIANDTEATSTVFTQTGSVKKVTSSSTGGGVTLETNGDVTLAKATIGGAEVNYLQVTKFKVANATGLPDPNSAISVGGYQDADGNFVELGLLDSNGLLDLSALSADQIAAITTVVEASNDGGNLTVGGNASVAGSLTVGGELVATQPYVDAAVTAEATARTNADDAEATARAAGDATLQGNIDQEVADRTAAVTAEAATRAADDATLQGNIDQEVADRTAAVTAEATARTNADAAEATARAAGDATLQGNIDQEVTDRTAAVTAEANARIAANNLRIAAEAAETTARQQADVMLQDAIDDEAATRALADSQINSRVNDVNERLDKVGAMSAAFSALVPSDRVGGNTQLSLGLGTYSSETALAIGAFHYLNDSVLINIGGSADTSFDEISGRAGITIGF